MSSFRQGDEGAAPPKLSPAHEVPKSDASAFNSHNVFSPMVAFVAVILYVLNFVWLSWRRSSKDDSA